MKKISLEAIQATILQQAEERGGLWPENAIYRQMVSEIGELGDVMNKTEGIKPPKPGEEDHDRAIEIADIFYALSCFASLNKISLTDAVLNKIQINQERDKDRFKK